MIKRLYRFVLETFIPVFAMTFLICLFILLMQFLWKYVNEMVGKGLSYKVLAEFFFFAAASLVPLTLPLSILLASLMTFGNLGERLELLSMKAAGISLLKIMKPLVVLMFFVSVGSFLYQNYVLPKVQVKMWALLFSMKQKSPELDIPEGVFYDQIPGYNLFVQSKNKKTGMLYDVMIYDFSKGFESSSVIVSDSADLMMTDDKKYLFMTIYQGETFENLKNQRTSYDNVPYRRESFAKKVVLIDFDASFNRMDDSFLQSQYVGMNIKQLSDAAKEASVEMDSVTKINAKTMGFVAPMVKQYTVQELIKQERVEDSIKTPSTKSLLAYKKVDIDSLFESKKVVDRQQIIERALSEARNAKQEVEYRSYQYTSLKAGKARYELEFNRKFTLAFACLVFFFLGAPLGAIVRKGGLGMPVVISVLLFIFYYIIDNTGYKFARDSRTDAWFGMWLSSFVLAPLGAFLTYKAMKDSVILNTDTYVLFFKRLFGKRIKREIVTKTIKLQDVSSVTLGTTLDQLNELANHLMIELEKRKSYASFWKEDNCYPQVFELSLLEEQVIDMVLESEFAQAQNKVVDYPEMELDELRIIPKKALVRKIFFYFIPVGIVIFIYAKFHHKRLIEDIYTIKRVNGEIANILPK